jgi:hypothetical protein
MLGIHPKTLQKLARAGTVPSHRIGEDYLHRQVCGGRMNLAEAQATFLGDWITAYKRYIPHRASR